MARRSDLQERILELLKDGVERKPSMIAYELREKKNTVKSALWRMEKKGLVKKTKHGFYIHPEAGVVETKHGQYYTVGVFEIHGLKLELDLKKLDETIKCNHVLTGSYLSTSRNAKNGSAPSGVKPSEFIVAKFREFYSHVPSRYHGKNHAEYKQIEVGINGRIVWVTVTIHEGKVIELWVKNTDVPFTIEDFIEFIGWVKGTFPCAGEGDWVVTQIGINKDGQLIEADGFRNLTIKQTKNEIYRIYNKRSIGKTRVEMHYSTKREQATSLSEALERFLGYNPERIKEHVEEAVRRALEENALTVKNDGLDELKEMIEQTVEINKEIEAIKTEVVALASELIQNDNLIAKGLVEILKMLKTEKMKELGEMKALKDEIERLKEREEEDLGGYR